MFHAISYRVAGGIQEFCEDGCLGCGFPPASGDNPAGMRDNPQIRAEKGVQDHSGGSWGVGRRGEGLVGEIAWIKGDIQVGCSAPGFGISKLGKSGFKVRFGKSGLGIP